MLSPDDVKQVVDALMQTAPMQYVISQMQSGTEAVPGPETPAPPGAPPAPAGVPEPAPSEPAGEEPYEPDDEDKAMLGRYMAGGCDDQEAVEYMAGKRKMRKQPRKYQAAGGTAEDQPVNKETGDVADPKITHYARQRAEQARYAKLERENRDLNQRMARLEQEKRAHYRRSRLQELSVEYAFDLEDELAYCQSLSDPHFEKHLSRVENYSRIPLADRTPPLYAPGVESRTGRESEKYQRERAEKIQQRVLREREKGHALSWEEAAELVDQAA